MDGTPIRQIAYFVPDIRTAALNHHRMFGSGPYFAIENIALSRSEHRGAPRPLDHSSAYGQWGEVMIEFVQQNNSGPSVFHDLYPEGSGQSGLHHLAIWVDDLDTAITGYEKFGFETALYAETETGTAFAMIDMVERYDHFLELYEPTETLTSFYDLIADAAGDFTGDEPLRSLG